MKLLNKFQPYFKYASSIRSSAISNRCLTIKSVGLMTNNSVTINTCGTLYDKWRKEKKFNKLSNGNLKFDVKYVDTFEKDASFKSPVVVALHGSPGSFADFSDLAPYLHSKGARVITPSFPDFTEYGPGIFRHSAEEKAEFIKDFLTAISVFEVDVLIVHSSAVYPGLLLCLNNNLVVKSFVMLCTGTHDIHKIKALKYLNVLKCLVKASEIPLVLKVLHHVGPTLLKIIKLPVKLDEFMNPLLAITTMLHANIPQSTEYFQNLSKSNFPMMYAFSENDPIIGKVSSYELANMLGVPEYDVQIYDKDGNIKQKGKENTTVKVMSFENGSHYVFWKHSAIIKNAIAEFMSKNKCI